MASGDSSLKTPFNKDSTLSNDDYNDPFYLHPSDHNPGNNLVSTLLDGDNYSTWVYAMQMALTVKKEKKIKKTQFFGWFYSTTRCHFIKSLCLVSLQHHGYVMAS